MNTGTFRLVNLNMPELLWNKKFATYAWRIRSSFYYSHYNITRCSSLGIFSNANCHSTFMVIFLLNELTIRKTWYLRLIPTIQFPSPACWVFTCLFRMVMTTGIVSLTAHWLVNTPYFWKISGKNKIKKKASDSQKLFQKHKIRVYKMTI